MMFKRTIKITSTLLVFIAAAYLIFAFCFGGFGKKPVTNLAFPRGDSMLLFAHRGISVYYPEHSLAATNEAKKLGFNAIEIDVRTSADNEYVIFHDEDGERLMGIKKSIDSMQLDEIKKYPLLFNGQKTGNKALTVKEFLSEFKNDFVIYFDMKIGSFKNADEIVKLVKEQGAESSCIIASSDLTFVFYIEAKYPEILTALEGFNSGKEWSYRFMPKKLKPDFLSGFFQSIDKSHVDWLNKNDLIYSRIVYGIERSNYKAAKDLGIKNLMLDYDSTMKNIFKDMTNQ